MQKIAPNQRHICNLWNIPRRNFLGRHHFKALPKQGFARFLRTFILIKQMEGIKVLVFRVNSIRGKASSEAVGTIVHGAHARHNRFARHLFALPGYDGRQGAPGGNPDVSFSFPLYLHLCHCVVSFPRGPFPPAPAPFPTLAVFTTKKKKKRPLCQEKIAFLDGMNAFAHWIAF